jgi:uncharacterized protein (TIGR02147 family)
MPQGRVNIFEFQDYREYLRRFYEVEKASSPTFSYRAFALRAGVRSPNHLKRIMDGDRSLTPAMLPRYSLALGLGTSEEAYLGALIAFTEARTHRERDKAYRKLLGFADYRRAHRLDAQHAEYHARWYIPAIRELTRRADFKLDAKWVARAVKPSITEVEAKDALRVLKELGLIARDQRGRVQQTNAVLTTGPQTRGAHIRRYHQTMLEQATIAMDTFAADERDFSCVTSCFDEDGVQNLKQLIAEFRRQVIALAESASDPAQVVQVNIQMFPLSDRKAHDRKAAK